MAAVREEQTEAGDMTNEFGVSWYARLWSRCFCLSNWVLFLDLNQVSRLQVL